MKTDSKERTKKEILREHNEDLLSNISEIIEILEEWQADIENHIEEIDEMKEENITKEQMEEEIYSDDMTIINKIRILIY